VAISAGASFFFALAETALFSLGKWQLRRLSERDPRSSAIITRLLAEPQDVLATMVLGNTFASAAMIAVGFWMVMRDHWPPILTVLSLLTLVLFGCEVLPKTLAVRRPEQWSQRLARLLLFIEKSSLPLRWAAQKTNTFLLAAVPKNIKPQPVSFDEEYQELLEVATQRGTLAQSEKEIILQIISMDRRTAKDVLRPQTPSWAF
jgi:putative hemolysin